MEMGRRQENSSREVHDSSGRLCTQLDNGTFKQWRVSEPNMWATSRWVHPAVRDRRYC